MCAQLNKLYLNPSLRLAQYHGNSSNNNKRPDHPHPLACHRAAPHPATRQVVPLICPVRAVVFRIARQPLATITKADPCMNGPRSR